MKYLSSREQVITLSQPHNTDTDNDQSTQNSDASNTQSFKDNDYNFFKTDKTSYGFPLAENGHLGTKFSADYFEKRRIANLSPGQQDMYDRRAFNEDDEEYPDIDDGLQSITQWEAQAENKWLNIINKNFKQEKLCIEEVPGFEGCPFIRYRCSDECFTFRIPDDPLLGDYLIEAHSNNCYFNAKIHNGAYIYKPGKESYGKWVSKWNFFVHLFFNDNYDSARDQKRVRRTLGPAGFMEGQKSDAHSQLVERLIREYAPITTPYFNLPLFSRDEDKHTIIGTTPEQMVPIVRRAGNKPPKKDAALDALDHYIGKTFNKEIVNEVETDKRPMSRYCVDHDDDVYIKTYLDDAPYIRVTDDRWDYMYPTEIPKEVVFRSNERSGKFNPTAGARISEINTLWDYVNIPQGMRSTVLSFLIKPFIDPESSAPILLLSGGANRGKTVTSQRLLELYDPLKSGCEEDTLPNTAADTFVLQVNRHGVVWGNMSGVSTTIQDALSQSCTGKQFQRRALYSDNTILADYIHTQAIVTTTSSDYVTMEDLKTRIVPVYLPSWGGVSGRDIKKLNRSWEEKDRNKVLGALLTLASKVKKYIDTVDFPARHVTRMEEFNDICEACSKVLEEEGLQQSSRPWYREVKRAHIRMTKGIEGDSMINYLCDHIDLKALYDNGEIDRWQKLTPSKLSDIVAEQAEKNGVNTSGWSDNGKRISNEIKDATPLLEEYFDVTCTRVKNRRTVLWTLDRKAPLEEEAEEADTHILCDAAELAAKNADLDKEAEEKAQADKEAEAAESAKDQTDDNASDNDSQTLKSLDEEVDDSVDSDDSEAYSDDSEHESVDSDTETQSDESQSDEAECDLEDDESLDSDSGVDSENDSESDSDSEIDLEDSEIDNPESEEDVDLNYDSEADSDSDDDSDDDSDSDSDDGSDDDGDNNPGGGSSNDDPKDPKDGPLTGETIPEEESDDSDNDTEGQTQNNETVFTEKETQQDQKPQDDGTYESVDKYGRTVIRKTPTFNDVFGNVIRRYRTKEEADAFFKDLEEGKRLTQQQEEQEKRRKEEENSKIPDTVQRLSTYPGMPSIEESVEILGDDLHLAGELSLDEALGKVFEECKRNFNKLNENILKVALLSGLSKRDRRFKRGVFDWREKRTKEIQNDFILENREAAGINVNTPGKFGFTKEEKEKAKTFFENTPKFSSSATTSRGDEMLAQSLMNTDLPLSDPKIDKKRKEANFSGHLYDKDYDGILVFISYTIIPAMISKEFYDELIAPLAISKEFFQTRRIIFPWEDDFNERSLLYYITQREGYAEYLAWYEAARQKGKRESQMIEESRKRRQERERARRREKYGDTALGGYN